MKVTHSDTQELLTPRQAAERLGLSPKTLANWRSRGGGPRFVRMGASDSRGAIRYPAIELRTWCAVRLVNSTSAATSTSSAKANP